MNHGLGADQLIATVVVRLYHDPPIVPDSPIPDKAADLPWDVILPILGVITFIVMAIYLRRTLRNWAGETEVQRWAERHQMRYSKRNDALSLNWAEKPFGYAARTCYNVVFGTYRGRRTILFDLGDLSSSGTAARLAFADDSATKQQLRGQAASVAVMTLPFFVESDLTLRPLKGVTRLWQHDKGGDRVELENEDFNRRYDVICNDRDLVYAFLTARTIEVLLAVPPVEIRVRGMQVMLIDDGPLRADLMDRWTALLAAIVENVDPYVWTDRGEAAAATRQPDWSTEFEL